MDERRREAVEKALIEKATEIAIQLLAETNDPDECARILERLRLYIESKGRLTS